MNNLTNYDVELLVKIKHHKKGTKAIACLFPHGVVTVGKGSQFCLNPEVWHHNAEEGVHFKMLEK